MFVKSILGVLSPVHIFWTIISRRARFAGTDNAGNRYYEARPGKGFNASRRWVLYKAGTGTPGVPPEWHGWLHHQSDAPPSGQDSSSRRSRGKQAAPEYQAGTGGMYRPPGSLLEGKGRSRATGDYEAWTPQQ